MDERYDIYFAGQLLDGQDLGQVRQQLASLFKADDKTLDLLFSGKPQLIKRDCDSATAGKYKAAMERAGAIALIAVSGKKPVTPTAPSPQSAAEKVAALAAAPDDVRYQQSESGSQTGETSPADSAAITPTSLTSNDNIELSPEGTEVLRENERSTPESREIDTSNLIVDTNAERLSEASEPPRVELDTGHLSMAEPGETIPNLPSAATPLSPNTDAIELSEPGADFSDCAAAEPPAPDIDLSRLSAQDPGADILEEKYRDKQTAEAPSTDHLSLED